MDILGIIYYCIIDLLFLPIRHIVAIIPMSAAFYGFKWIVTPLNYILLCNSKMIKLQNLAWMSARCSLRVSNPLSLILNQIHHQLKQCRSSSSDPRSASTFDIRFQPARLKAWPQIKQVGLSPDQLESCIHGLCSRLRAWQRDLVTTRSRCITLINVNESSL